MFTRNKTSFILMFVLLSQIASAGVTAATQVAVVADSPGHKLPDWVASLQTSLASEPDFKFVAQHEVDRVMDQQSITAAIDSADLSIELCKLLSAQVLAVINADASGVIIFDGETGVRLANFALPVDPQNASRSFSDRIKAAVTKRNLSPDQRHTVCLSTVRNVDLPPDSAAVCKVEALLIERQLANSPTVIVLERQRLEKSRSHRSDPAVANKLGQLASSVITLELQVSRERDTQVKLTCLLTDAAEKSMDSPSVVGDVNNPAKLADAAAQAICQSLHATIAPSIQNVKEESRRFLAEAHFHTAHRQRQQALEDTEAAHALDPESPACQSYLALMQLMRGVELLCSFDETEESHPFVLWLGSTKPQDIGDSLKLVASGEQKLLELPQARSYPSAADDFALGLKLLDAYIAPVGRHLYAPVYAPGEIAPQVLPEQKVLFDRIQIVYRRYRREVQQPLAFKAVKDRASLDQYSTYLDQFLIDSRFCFSQNCSEWTADFANLIPPWVDLVERFDEPSPNPFLRSHPLRPTGHAREDPISQLLLHLPDSFSQEMDPFSNGASETAQHRLALASCSHQDLDQLDTAFNAIAKRRDSAFAQASNNGLNSTAQLRWKAKSAVAPSVQRRTPDLLAGEISPTSAQPVATDEQTQPGLFWKEARTLIDVSQQDQNVRTLCCPLVDAGNIYCMAFSDEPTGPALQVLQFNPVDGKCVVIGQKIDDSYAGRIRKSTDTLRERLNSIWLGYQCSIADGNYIIVSPESTVFLFPLKGGPPQIIEPSAGLPGKWFNCATAISGKFYAALDDEIIVEYDLKTLKCETLASAQRKEHRTPFDDSPPFQVQSMTPDLPRDRFVFCANSQKGDPEKNGMWEFNFKTRAFRQLASGPHTDNASTRPIGAPHFDSRIIPWAGDDLICVNTERWSFAYNVQKDKVAPSPRQLTPRNINDHVSITRQQAIQGDWIWSSIDISPQSNGHSAIARLDAKKQIMQIFPPLRTVETPAYMWPVYLQTVDAERMLVGDQFGLWVVTAPDHTRSAVETPVDPATENQSMPLEKPISAGQLPWPSGKTLYDYAQKPGKFDFTVRPQPYKNSIYALGLGHTGSDLTPSQRYVQLVRFSPQEGSITELESLATTSTNWPTKSYTKNSTSNRPRQRTKLSFRYINATAFSDDSLFAATSTAIMQFPLDGSPGRQIHPKVGNLRGANSIAWLDGSLYCVTREPTHIALLKYDFKTETAESIIDEKIQNGVDSLSRDALEIPFIAADADRHRLILVKRTPNLSNDSSGVWAYMPESKKLSCIMPLFLTPVGLGSVWPGRTVYFHWATTDERGHLLMMTARGLIDLNLKTDIPRRVQQHIADIDVLAPTSQPTTEPIEAADNDLLGGKIFISPPVAMDEHWLWMAMTWGRTSLDGKVWQSFPALRPDDANFVPNETLQLFDHGHHLLVADSLGCWILDRPNAD